LMWMYEFAVMLFNDPRAPLVNSLSYATVEYQMCNATLNGWPNEECSILDVAAAGYLHRSNLEILKLSLRGITVLAASGDSGAPSENNQNCSLDDTANPIYALYPASSPYVLAVGGINLLELKSGSNSPQPPICEKSGGLCAGSDYTLEPSMVTNGFITTGGGFSNFTSALWYQREAVEGFLSSTAFRPPTQYFNPSNRAYPDVSGLATNVLIVIDGEVSRGAGTSASTPVTAGLLTLVNDHLLSQGLPPLGCVNPLIYQMAKDWPTAFQDVVVGNNTCTETNCCKYGYGSTKGWDPVTGLGALNFPEMIKYIDSIHQLKSRRRQNKP